MIQPIMKDEAFLAIPSSPAGPQDAPAAADLLDTIEAHKEACVGMAANMIGISRRIIVFDNDGTWMLMYNPEIIRKKGPYTAQEGCLSLEGVRTVRRWQSIKVRYENDNFQVRLKTFTGWTAQIIQHEVDHCDGILI